MCIRDRSTYCDSLFISAADFKHLNIEFLSTDFGFYQLVNTATHGNNLMDKMFVSHPDIYISALLANVYYTWP